MSRALAHVAEVEPGAEPAHARRRGAVRERLWRHLAPRVGTVTLRGNVDSSGSKAAAAEIAKATDGVKGVKNEPQVVAPSQRAAVDISSRVAEAPETGAFRRTCSPWRR
jgi:hypothetical protein